jgi:predicted esterase
MADISKSSKVLKTTQKNATLASKIPKKVFIIPGFRHTATSKAYREIAKFLKAEGYQPIPVKIPWKQTTISENTEYFLKQYKKRTVSEGLKRQKTYILGFSFGAMIAFLASTKVRVNGLMLCSLSPFFKEDVKKLNVKNARDEDFKTLHCGTLAKKIKAKKVLMFYGAKETNPLIKRVKSAYRQISSDKKYLVSIKKTEHDIGHKNYLSAIYTATKMLL